MGNENSQNIGIRRFIFNKAYLVDRVLLFVILLYIAGLLASAIRGIHFFNFMQAARWSFIVVLATVIFFFVKKGDMLNSHIRACLIKYGDKLTVKLGKKTFSGVVILITGEKLHDIPKGYTDITKKVKRFRMISAHKRIIIDVGKKECLRLSLVDNIVLL